MAIAAGVKTVRKGIRFLASFAWVGPEPQPFEVTSTLLSTAVWPLGYGEVIEKGRMAELARRAKARRINKLELEVIYSIDISDQ